MMVFEVPGRCQSVAQPERRIAVKNAPDSLNTDLFIA